MLGSEVLSKLSHLENAEILACYREQLEIDCFGKYKRKYQELVHDFNPDYVINCAVITHRNVGAFGIAQQLVVNGLFPRYLAKKSEVHGYFMVQVSTDGVFYGKKGGYYESVRKYPRSIYSFSKILGERVSDSVLILRTSLVGRSNRNQEFPSLLDWFADQEQGASISGFTNHLWNGVTTDYFAKLISGIVAKEYRLGGVQHFIPSDVVSKSELLEHFKQVLRRQDIDVQAKRASKSIRRNLVTQNPDRNELFWNITGLAMVPSIEELLYLSWSE